MKKSDIKEGVYFTECNEDGDVGYINLVRDDKIDNIDPSYKGYIEGSDRNNFSSTWNHLRPSTPEEIAWIDACREAGKFVPMSKVKLKSETYEIY